MPPLVMVMPSAKNAREVVSATFTAIAPATEIGVPLEELPSPLVEAFGDSVWPLLDPPLSVDVELRKPSWSSVFWFAFFPDVSLSLSGAPLTLAFASAPLCDEPSACTLTAPPALTERLTLASTVSSAIVTAIEMPTAVERELVLPVDFVVAPAVCSARPSRAPPSMVVPARVPSRAVVVSCAKSTAMTGVTAVPVVAFAPFLASVVRVLPPVAEMVRSWAPVMTAPSCTSASVLSMTTATPIERPRPKSVDDAPSAESAFVVVSPVEAAGGAAPAGGAGLGGFFPGPPAGLPPRGGVAGGARGDPPAGRADDQAGADGRALVAEGDGHGDGRGDGDLLLVPAAVLLGALGARCGRRARAGRVRAGAERGVGLVVGEAALLLHLLIDGLLRAVGVLVRCVVLVGGAGGRRGGLGGAVR